MSPPPRAAAVSFDLDATLLDNGFIPDTIAACCRYVADRLGHPDTTAIASANAEAFRSSWPETESQWALGGITGEEMVRDIWRRALAACDDGDHDELLDDLVAEHLRLDREQARLYADVRPTLDGLRQRGHRLALITNGASDTQRTRLASLGIADRFDAIVISAEVGALKPHPSLFRRAANQLGVQGRELWHVGDNLATDVAGALAAGHIAVWLNRLGVERGPDDPEPHVELRSLDELLLDDR